MEQSMVLFIIFVFYHNIISYSSITTNLYCIFTPFSIGTCLPTQCTAAAAEHEVSFGKN